MKKQVLSVVIAIFAAVPLLAVSGPGQLVPKPVEVTAGEGVCDLSTARVTVKKASPGMRRALRQVTDARLREEAYEITIRPGKVVIRSFAPLGEIRARQTLSQLKALDPETACCRILDYPRFRHRGLLIDESRSFKGKAFLFKQMDAMALLKLNVLHLHLTDAAGWRVRIDAYPRLTDQAAWRIGKDYFAWDRNGYPFSSADDPDAYGGFYSKEDIRDIVAYAAERGITVIPEIEMPGHSMEVNRAYPEMACETAEGKALPFSWDLCAGREETYTFLETVLTEVIDLFPSEFIHIGGDEAVMKDWPRCVHCQRRMAAEGMTEVAQLQGYMIRRMDAFVRSKGRRIIGWDEILETGIPAEAAVQSWRGIRAGREAAKAGHDVVMSPTDFCYFDYYQDLIVKEPPAAGPLNSIRHVYAFDPAPTGDPHILGLQGNLWCEFIPEPAHAEYMLYPRALAIAEIGWTPQAERDYADFRPRAERFCELLHERGYRTFDLSAESPRAQSYAFEKSNGSFNYLTQEGGGAVLSYRLGTGVRIIVADGFAFKDMNANGTLDPFEDWRLAPEVRAADLAARREPVPGLPEMPDGSLFAFRSGLIDNPFHYKTE